MLTKLMVIVKEVYEEEGKNEVFSHKETGQVISVWDFNNSEKIQKDEYVRKVEPTGKMIRQEKSEAEYEQVFDKLSIPDLVLYLNRIK